MLTRNIALTLLALGAVLLMQKTTVPRGIRLNNPGNIKHGDDWQGMSAEQADPDFITFISPVWGIRAMARTLTTYSTSYGLNTVEGIIGRWAPESENDTASYIAHVASALGVDKGQPFRVLELLSELIAVIILHENGVQPYTWETIREGVAIA